jgi:hypothetical protein
MLFSPGLYLPMGKKPGAAVVAATTFDPAHNTNATLSPDKLTANATGTANFGVYSIAPTTANQKAYVEFTVTTLVPGDPFIIGFGNDNTITGRFPGSNVSPSHGFATNGGAQFNCLDSADNATAILLSAIVQGDLVDVAVDTANSKFWMRVNNGGWNAGQGGTQDPATNQGGVTYSPVTGPFYFFVGIDATAGDGGTVRFSSTSWLHTPPSGFTQPA